MLSVELLTQRVALRKIMQGSHAVPAGAHEFFRQLVEDAYEAVLLRAADPASLERWSADLEQGRAALSDLLRFLLGSGEFAGKADRFLESHVAGAHKIKDHSQNGELGVLLPHLFDLPDNGRVVVDVGAHARQGSNSYDLMRALGWKGVLIEPNPGLIDGLQRDFDGLDFSIHQLAVSDEPRRAKLHFGIHPEISSLVRSSTEQWGEVTNEVEVEVVRLSGLLDQESVPHDFGLLSIDAEGEDLRILTDVLSNGFRPRWMILEAYKASEVTGLDPAQYPAQLVDDYDIVGTTYANLILRRKPGLA
ncbi:FkbM family methyltransferase [Brevundimonas sp. UYEF29]|uniref:FkbM family methyltransferase n=1 Tax=Brevundimonas sp. UYEF29 TaxID=3156346 RepID=UPI0033927D94